MTEKNVVTAIHDTLHEQMAGDERIVVLGEDVAVRGGVFRVTQGFLEEFGEQRVIDTPLAEAAIIGVAVGMALHGLLPICAWCKKVRNDGGSWEQIEVYVRNHTEATFSHGICPECRAKVEAEAAIED